MRRSIALALAFVGAVGIPATGAAQDQDQPTHRSARRALRYFESLQEEDVQGFLERLRRPAPSPAVRAMVIAGLPEDGELIPTAQEAEKLAVIPAVLAFHGRTHDIELRLVAGGGIAFVGLHARTVLVISREALDLVNADELLAVMAHELGHDYMWDEYEQARQQRDHRRLQELELRCDGIAVITMDGLRVDPERLVSAATKLARYNQYPRDPRYVPLDQRVRFIRAIVKLMAKHRVQVSR